MTPLIRAVAAVAVFGMLFTRDVHAYLDPGSGSMALQALLAGLVAAAYAVRTYWGRLAAFFTRLPPASVPEPVRESPDPDSQGT